jgi:hypothetical protein
MSAMVPYERNGVARRGRRRGTGVLQFASGGVAADVRVERVDRRNRCSWYAIKLAANESGVTGRLVGVRRGGAVDELGSVEAAAGSASSALFAVTTPRTGAYQAMFLEVRSDEMLLRVDAPRPPAPSKLGALKPAAALLALGVVAVSAGTIPLALAHDGRHAEAPHATITAEFPHPKSFVPVAPARVQSFAARRDATLGGRETVLASYLAVGERGTIALLDAEGTVIASAPFTRVGTVRLPVPPAYRTLSMTAQITVHRGATKAVSSVAVPPNALATPSPSPSPSSEPAAEAVTPIDSASSGVTGGIMAIEGHAVAGRPLRLRLAAQASPVRIELEDETGAAITETQVPPGATHASLPLPAAPERATYLIALHYTRDGGEETVIRTVVTAPKPKTQPVAAR